MTDYAFQQAGIEFLERNTRALLGDEPGLGKSRQLILAATEPVLIVAPAMVLDAGVWQNEVARWRPGLDARAVAYTGLCQRERTGNGTGTRPLPIPKPEFTREWGTIIFDEAHYLKGRKTIWTQAAAHLHAERTYLATGTPIPNYADELFMLLRFMWGFDDKRFTSYWRWLKEWFATWKPPWGGTQVLGLRQCTPECSKLDRCVHWDEFFHQNLGERYLQRLRDDVLDDLPPLTEQHIYVGMGLAQKKAYREIRKDFLTWIDDHELTAWNTAAQATQLVKLSTGLELFNGKGSAKLDYLAELLKDRKGSPTLVLGYFRDTLTAAGQVCDRLGLEHDRLAGDTSKAARSGVVTAFQSGGLDVLLGSLSVIKEGLTLTKADTVIFLEHSYRPSTNIQALRRIHRIGQDRPVTAIHLWTEKTVDGNMRKTLETKTDQQVKALSAGQVRELV